MIFTENKNNVNGQGRKINITCEIYRMLVISEGSKLVAWHFNFKILDGNA